MRGKQVIKGSGCSIWHQVLCIFKNDFHPQCSFHCAMITGGTQDTCCYLLLLNNRTPSQEKKKKRTIRKSGCWSASYLMCHCLLNTEHSSLPWDAGKKIVLWISLTFSRHFIYIRASVSWLVKAACFAWKGATGARVRTCEADGSSVNTSSFLTLER